MVRVEPLNQTTVNASIANELPSSQKISTNLPEVTKTVKQACKDAVRSAFFKNDSKIDAVQIVNDASKANGNRRCSFIHFPSRSTIIKTAAAVVVAGLGAGYYYKFGMPEFMANSAASLGAIFSRNSTVADHVNPDLSTANQ